MRACTCARARVRVPVRVRMRVRYPSFPSVEIGGGLMGFGVPYYYNGGQSGFKMDPEIDLDWRL